MHYFSPVLSSNAQPYSTSMSRYSVMHHYPFSNIGDASLTFLKIYGDASLTFLKDLCDASLAPMVAVLVMHYFSQVFFSNAQTYSTSM